MLVVLVVLLAVLALVLLMLLLQTRAELGSARDSLTTAQKDLDAGTEKIQRLDAEVVRLDTELTGTRAAIGELEAARDDAVDEATTAGGRIAELEAEIEAKSATEASLEASLAEANAGLAASRVAADEQTAAAEAAATEVLDLTHQNEALQVELVEAADEAAKRRAPSVPNVFVTDDDAGIDVSGFSPGMAWELELVRSERTWRYSVAANPVEDPSPFDDTDNPLKLAIEIEALALREDVGAFIGIDWRAGNAIHPGTDPARAHLTLRLAQELLASAAREMSPSTLVVRPDPERGGVSLEVVASDPDDVDFKIPPPPIASEWIGIDEHGGMVVTVKVDDT